MTTRKYKTEVIDIILDNRNDFYALCVQIAKDNPASIVKAFDKIKDKIKDEDPESIIVEQVKDLLSRSMKVHAIKYVRDVRGDSLKEALTYVDSIRDKFFPG